MKWWMRMVGGFYLLLFVAVAILKLPVQAEGPEGTLALAAAGDAMARFVVDTWVTYGVDFLVVGAALVIFSARPEQARALVWTVLGLELFRGIGIDIYKLARGYAVTPMLVWMAIHAVIIASGFRLLRSTREKA